MERKRPCSGESRGSAAMVATFCNSVPISSSLHPLYFCFLLFCLLLPRCSSVYFQKSHFDIGTSDIIYQGDAVPSIGAVQFNRIDFVCRVGWVTYAQKVPIWEPSTGRVSDFITRFSFMIDTLGNLGYGHGIAFFIAPFGYKIPPNSNGGFLGLFNTTTSDSTHNQIVLVEFDSFVNKEWDPTYEHVGINSNSIHSAVTTPWNASLHSGDTADAQIVYNGTTKNLTVSWTYQKTFNPQEKTSLTHQIDLKAILPEWVMIGFSAATTHILEQHTLYSWEFSSSLDIKDIKHEKTKSTKLIVGLVVPLGFLLIVGIVVCAIIRRSKHEKAAETMNLNSIDEDLERSAGPRKFNYLNLAYATNNFSSQRKLGEGGFGCVFRGYLNELDIPVAVKKISQGSKQGKKEYLTEIKVISRLRHRNLVQLIGWCHDKGKFLLVYEFMPNGSLDLHLFGKTKPLSWGLRFKIVQGLASGLLYLHEEWEQCVIHRDIKPSNIMLDSSFTAKLGDFGLARLINHEVDPQTTGLAGTFGYMAPEYVTTGRASKESDVFSFGVVALEIATGRRAVDPGTENSQLGLVHWVWDLYGQGNLSLGIDEALSMDCDIAQVERLMIVGLWCAHPDHRIRPSIRQAIHSLELQLPPPVLPLEMPVATYHAPVRPTPAMNSSEPSLTYTSLNAGR